MSELGRRVANLEVAISHNCKAQLIPLFYPQVCKCLIFKGVYFLHRQVIGHFFQVFAGVLTVRGSKVGQSIRVAGEGRNY